MDKHEKALSSEEDDLTDTMQRLRSIVIYEIVRKEGEEELNRPLSSLWWAGVAAGVAISASLLGEALLHSHLPDAPWRPLITSFGYCLGFVIVIIGRLQLFTENTITAVLPLLKNFALITLCKTARIWGVVFAANMVGTFITALLSTYGKTVHPEHFASILEVSRHFAEMSFMEAFRYGIPAGFFVAAIVWMLPSAPHSRILTIVLLTYLIAVGEFAHVIVGSAEVFTLILNSELGVLRGLFGLILPALLGNIIGGTGLFALLAYGQVREEMEGDE